MLTNNEKIEIAKIYATTCKAFDKTLEPDVLRLQIEDLADLEYVEIINALEKYRRDPKNSLWPKANKIREIIKPKMSTDTLANEAASRIRSAIVKFGWNNGKDARAYIGELGWIVVERCGGWSLLCENHGLDLNPLTFHAQSRDMAKAICESEKTGAFDIPVSLPEKENLKVLDFVKIKEIEK